MNSLIINEYVKVKKKTKFKNFFFPFHSLKDIFCLQERQLIFKYLIIFVHNYKDIFNNFHV